MSAPTLEIPLPAPAALDRSQPYPALLARLSEMSVRKQHDPYRDVGWDEPEHQFDAEDPRMRLFPGHALARTEWYQGLPAAAQARFGTALTMQTAKYAIELESVLSRGLLCFAPRLPNRSPEYRYVMHELVEEGRHSMMFQELINRSGADPQPVGRFDEFWDHRIAGLGRSFPELFFFAVLGGEIFIDQQNRECLRQPREFVHPLVRRVMQIHVTEEARHVCFAENYLREHLPGCSALARETMAWVVPVIFSESKRLMLVPDRRLVREFRIPKRTIAEAFGQGTEHRRVIAATVEPVRKLCAEHGMFAPRHARLWRALGLTE